MIITRRSILAGILAAATGPAIVRVSSLMVLPPSKIIVPEPKILTFTVAGEDWLEDLKSKVKAHTDTDVIMTGEIGWTEGFRFIESPYLVVGSAKKNSKGRRGIWI